MTSTAARRWAAAAVGIIAAGAGLGAAQLMAALTAPASAPLVVVGSALLDLAPGWAKEAVISVFGTSDKPALLVAIGVVLAVVAALAGVLEQRRPPLGGLLLGALGIVGAVAAISRHSAGTFAVVPAIGAGVVAVCALRFLVPRIPLPMPRDADGADGADGADTTTGTTAVPGIGRRGFLIRGGAIAALGVLAALGGAAAETGSRTVAAVRAALRLPKPATRAAALPDGADLGIRGLSPIVTPNADFYRIDTALRVPQIDPADWKLVITGMVDREVTLTWDQLLRLPLEESYTTLTCVSNEVGGDLIGTARWLGYPIRHLLARAGVHGNADMVLSTSEDGFTAGTPIEALQEEGRNAILAVGMNGEPLPVEHGFPVRMVVPGLYGYVSATKWVVKLEVTRYDRAEAYWTRQGWGPKGPIKLESRIDVARASAGGLLAAGVAWHQHVGVSGVEVRLDDGDWQQAEISTPISADTWVQWRLNLPAAAGDHTLAVRAIGADGEVQTAKVADVLPDGATGYHTVQVAV